MRPGWLVDAVLGGVLCFSLGAGITTAYVFTTHHPTFAANLEGARHYERMREEIPKLRAEMDWVLCRERLRQRTWASWRTLREDCRGLAP